MNQFISEPLLGHYLISGEPVSQTLLEKLSELNANYSKNKNFPSYIRGIQQIFQLSPLTEKTLASKFYLGGFLEGEGSLNVGAKKNNVSQFKVYLDPEFNLTQHLNGISNLYLAMYVFQTGRIRFKSGSLATFVYTIDNRQSLEEKVLPFYEKYVNPFGSKVKKRRCLIFKNLLTLFKTKAHLNFKQMVHEVLPLWDQLRLQKGHTNETFKNLLEAQNYVKKAYNEKNK